jgi:predicted phage gp36 major capsid-like protein
MEIPIQWHAGASFLMNQRTAALLMTMSDATGKPLLGSMQGLQPSRGSVCAASAGSQWWLPG